MSASRTPKDIFTSHRYKSTVRIPVRYTKGLLEYFYGGALPALMEGTIADLIVDRDMLLDPSDAQLLNQEEKIELLPKDVELLVRIAPDSIPDELRKKCKQAVDLSDRGSSTCVLVILASPLFMKWRGPKRGALAPCQCHIPALQTEAGSLNHAYRLVSEAFEPHRRSHAGNVFSEVYYNVKDGWRPLDEIRAQKEAELEPRLRRGIAEKVNHG